MRYYRTTLRPEQIHKLKAAGGGYWLKGVIDRLEKQEDGSYKLPDSLRPKQIETPETERAADLAKWAEVVSNFEIHRNESPNPFSEALGIIEISMEGKVYDIYDRKGAADILIRDRKPGMQILFSVDYPREYPRDEWNPE